MRPIKQIVVHCSATPITMDIGVDEIRHLHTAPKNELIPWGKQKLYGKHWSDVGYHAIIRRNGAVEDGRPIEKVGAHVRGHNAYSFAICLVGGVDENGNPDFNYTRHQMETLSRLLDVLENEFPDAERMGHRDFPGVHKACPCFNVKEFYNGI